MKRSLIIICTSMTFILLSQSASAAILFVDIGGNDFRISSIEDLDVGGTFYDVTFHDVSDFEGATRNWNDYLNNSGVTDPIIFTSPGSSSAAINAVKAEISSATVNASSAIDSHFQLLLPFNDLGGSVQHQTIGRNSLNPLTYNSGPNVSTIGKSGNFGQTAALLEFDEVSAVPEPSAFTLPALAGVSVAGYSLRRRALS